MNYYAFYRGHFPPFGNVVFEKVFEFSHLKQTNKKRLSLKASLDRMIFSFFDEFMRQQFRLYIRKIFQLGNNTSREEGISWDLRQTTLDKTPRKGVGVGQEN